MKTRLLLSFHTIARDRQVFAACLAVIALALCYVVFVGLAIQPTELQVATHYSAFGETHFYRSQWYTIAALAGFGLIVPALHIAIVARLLRDELRTFALYFSYLTIFMIILAFIYARSILSVAFLS